MVKRWNNKAIKTETGKKTERRGERCNARAIGLAFALQGELAPPVWRWLMGCLDHRQKQLVSINADGTWPTDTESPEGCSASG